MVMICFILIFFICYKLQLQDTLDKVSVLFLTGERPFPHRETLVSSPRNDSYLTEERHPSLQTF